MYAMKHYEEFIRVATVANVLEQSDDDDDDDDRMRCHYT